MKLVPQLATLDLMVVIIRLVSSSLLIVKESYVILQLKRKIADAANRLRTAKEDLLPPLNLTRL